MKARSQRNAALAPDTVLPHDAANQTPIAQAKSFRWTFGDGVTATTSTVTVDHQYPGELERQDERNTFYLVKVEAIDDSGRTMNTGYATVEIPNLLQQMKKDHGLLQLALVQEPGSTEAPDGSRFVDITLVNLDKSETANLTKAVVQWKPCGGGNADEAELALGSIFAEQVIPPRGRISGRFSVPRAQVEKVCWADVHVSGDSSPGRLEVAGFFGLDTQRAEGIPLDSPEQHQAIQKVYDALGYSMDKPGTVVIPDDTIRQLEEDGQIEKGVLRKHPFVQPSAPAP